MNGNGEVTLSPKAMDEFARAMGNACDSAAEKQMAGIAAGWHKQLARVKDKLKPHHFVDVVHRAFYETGLEMLADGLPDEDGVLFSGRLKQRTDSGGELGTEDVKYLVSHLTNNVQSIAHTDYYADLVIEKHQQREGLQFYKSQIRLLADGADLSVVDERLEEFVSQRETLPKDLIGSFSGMAKKQENQALRPVVIDNIVREGETINVVSDSKVGKTWFVHMLALLVAVGKDWLGFPVQQGKVLVLDNELHEPTFVHRIQQIAKALQLDETAYADNLHVECFRGRLVDIHAVVARLKRIPPGTYKLVILDSLYRFAPKDFDENSNSDTTAIYNLIDSAAAHLGCAIVCVRHSSKGSQSNKSVTDTGAGAGAQSRAADCHLVLRAHEEEGAFVLAAALRSFAKFDPFVVRFEWPLFFTAPELDPLLLAPDKPRKPKPKGDAGDPPIPEWNGERFGREFLTSVAQTRAAIIEAATKAGLSKAQAEHFMKIVEGNGTAHLHRGTDKRQKWYANVPQFLITDQRETA